MLVKRRGVVSNLRALEYCFEENCRICGRTIRWHLYVERWNDENREMRFDHKQRFYRCAPCAARLWEHRHEPQWPIGL